MEYKFYIGIDISKNTLDATCLNIHLPDKTTHLKMTNDELGLSGMKKWLFEQDGFSIEKTLFCMEHTGIYNLPLLQFLDKHEANIWLENAVQIKQSAGMIRGKNDKVDSFRIAQYAARNTERARLWKPERKQLETLRHLMSLRNRLVETKKRLLTPVEEFREMGNDNMAKILEKAMRKSVRSLEQDLQALENQIKQLLDDDDHLRGLFQLVTSVVGIGFVTAVNLIIHTNEFRQLMDPRKLACYCGVAPFEHSSGTSFRKKNRVSHMANKKLKTNLHMASLSSVKLDDGLRKYYERKVAEGKNKMSVLNAVKNKLIARVIAVVKRGTPYQKIISENSLVLS